MLSKSEGFKRFRGWVAQQKISIDPSSDRVWKYYDYGPKESPPIIFLPGTTGTAEIYYKQFLSLCPKGIRCISVQPPDYMTHEAFLKGLEKFMEKLEIQKAHLFGTSFSGYEIQLFAQYRPLKVCSLILCNSFSDVTYYKDNAPCVEIFPFMPEFMLKRVLLENLPRGKLESEIADSVDFMVEQLESLKQKELASRLTLNCTTPNKPLKPSEWNFNQKRILIIDSLDEVAIPEKLREEVYKYYPEAKIAELKTGGNFPYLSRADEINMYIQVHLRAIDAIEQEEKQNKDEQKNPTDADVKTTEAHIESE